MLLSNIISFTIHLDVHTKITIWIIILVGVLIFLCNSLNVTTNIHNQTKVTIWIIVIISLFLFLSNINRLTINNHVKTQRSTSWIIITSCPQDLFTSLNLLFRCFTFWIWVIRKSSLSNTEVITTHSNIQTKITIWIIISSSSHN